MRLERHLVPLSLAAGVVLSIGLGAGLASALGQPPDTLPLSEIRPGMKGYGLTVFSGVTPEKFDVEVISILHNFRPAQDLVLVKTPHPKLDLAKTVAGMSGSPIYLNGKMIGAYAYGWLFGAEPIAGVTPIKNMLDELARPVPPGFLPRVGPTVALREAEHGTRSTRAFEHVAGAFAAADRYDLATHAKQLASRNEAQFAPPPGSTFTRASTPLMVGGLGPLGLKMASDLLGPLGLEPLQGGGGSAKSEEGAPTHYVDGGAIGVEMVKGDVSAMGLGTVTKVVGNKLVAFGHPMLGGGIEALPTAIGRVHWILASVNRSFKIGEAARSLGTLVNDRQAAIVVDASVKAPTFPMHVQIEGAPGIPKPSWNMVIAEDQFMAPSFTAMALGNALETSTAERRDMTYRVESRIKIAKYGTIVVKDFGAGNGSPIGPEDFGRGKLARAVGALLNNPWESVTIERVDSVAKVSFAQDVYRLRGAKILEPVIDAGASVHIRVDLEPYLGKPETRVIEVKVPAELAGRDVEIELTPGFDTERPYPSPDTIADLIAALPNQTYDPQSLVASFRVRQTSAAYKGKVATRLPPGAVDMLRSQTDSNMPETFASFVHVVVPMSKFVVGHDTVHVTIRPVLR